MEPQFGKSKPQSFSKHPNNVTNSAQNSSLAGAASIQTNPSAQQMLPPDFQRNFSEPAQGMLGTGGGSPDQRQYVRQTSKLSIDKLAHMHRQNTGGRLRDFGNQPLNPFARQNSHISGISSHYLSQSSFASRNSGQVEQDSSSLPTIHQKHQRLKARQKSKRSLQSRQQIVVQEFVARSPKEQVHIRQKHRASDLEDTSEGIAHSSSFDPQQALAVPGKQKSFASNEPIQRKVSDLSENSKNLQLKARQMTLISNQSKKSKSRRTGRKKEGTPQNKETNQIMPSERSPISPSKEKGIRKTIDAIAQPLLMQRQLTIEQHRNNPAAKSKRSQFKQNASKVFTNATKDLEVLFGNMDYTKKATMHSKMSKQNMSKRHLNQNADLYQQPAMQSPPDSSFESMDLEDSCSSMTDSVSKDGKQTKDQQSFSTNVKMLQQMTPSKDEKLNSLTLNYGIGQSIKNSMNMSMQSKHSAHPMGSRLMLPEVEYDQKEKMGYFKQNTAISKNKNKNMRERRASRRLQKMKSPFFNENIINMDNTSGAGFKVFTTEQLRNVQQESGAPNSYAEELSLQARFTGDPISSNQKKYNNPLTGETSTQGARKAKGIAKTGQSKVFFNQKASDQEKILQRSLTQDKKNSRKDRRKSMDILLGHESNEPPQQNEGIFNRLIRKWTKNSIGTETSAPKNFMRQQTHGAKIEKKNKEDKLLEEAFPKSSHAPDGDDSQRKSLIGNMALNRSERNHSDNSNLLDGKVREDSEKATFRHQSIVSEHGGESLADNHAIPRIELQVVDQRSDESQGQDNIRFPEFDDQSIQDENGQDQRPNLGQQGSLDPEKLEDQQEADYDNKHALNRKKVVKALLCYPEDKIKLAWDIFTSIVLIAACFFTPFSLAFEKLDEEEDSNFFQFGSTWGIFESIIDIVFLIEIIVCFNTSIYDQATNEYLTSRCKIAKNYLGGWFFIDFMAIFPRLLRFLSIQTWTEVLKFLKIARIGRLIKLLRILKIAKTLKQKDMMQKHMVTKMRLNVAKERLLIFAIFSILFVHTITCLWIFLGAYNMDDEHIENWIESFGYNIDKIGEMYTIGFYWTITTITTVGYGDISATNTEERILASFIMIIGVIAFSFSTGSLSSIIQNVDSRQAAYRQRLDVLKELRMSYGIDDNLYMELNAFINFQSSQHHQERDTFINELPDRLKFRVSKLLYAEYSKKIRFFKNVSDNSNFIAWVCPNLKPLEVIQGALVQVEQEKLSCISFIRVGEVAYVSQRYREHPYLICSEGDSFGILDIIFRRREYEQRQFKKKEEKRERRMKRHAQLAGIDDYETSSSDYSSSEEEEEDFAVMSSKIKCKFTIKAETTCFLLQMQKSALQKMYIEFPEIFTKMLADEIHVCIHAVRAKAKLIDYLENQQQDGASQQVCYNRELLSSRMLNTYKGQEEDSPDVPQESRTDRSPSEGERINVNDVEQQQLAPHTEYDSNIHPAISATSQLGQGSMDRKISSDEMMDQQFDQNQLPRQRQNSSKVGWTGPATINEVRLLDIKEESSQSALTTSDLDTDPELKDEKPLVQILGFSQLEENTSLTDSPNSPEQKRLTLNPTNNIKLIELGGESEQSQRRSFTLENNGKPKVAEQRKSALSIPQSGIEDGAQKPIKSLDLKASATISSQKSGGQASIKRSVTVSSKASKSSKQLRRDSLKSLKVGISGTASHGNLDKNSHYSSDPDSKSAASNRELPSSQKMKLLADENSSPSPSRPRQDQKFAARQRRASRFEKNMDEDELLVLQDFAADVKNKGAGKYARNLVRTSTKRDHHIHRLGTKKNNQNRFLNLQANSNAGELEMQRTQSHQIPSQFLKAASGDMSKGERRSSVRIQPKINVQLRQNSNEIDEHSNSGFFDRMLLGSQTPAARNTKTLFNQEATLQPQPQNFSTFMSPSHLAQQRTQQEFSQTLSPSLSQSPPLYKKYSDSTQLSPEKNFAITPQIVLMEKSVDRVATKPINLESLIAETQRLQQFIADKVGKMQLDVNNVKTDQVQLIQKSDQIRSSHEELLKLTRSEAAKSQEDLSRKVNNSSGMKKGSPQDSQQQQSSRLSNFSADSQVQVQNVEDSREEQKKQPSQAQDLPERQDARDNFMLS